MQVKFYAAFVFIFFALVLIGNVHALTGSLGNARMVLKAEAGEEIEKYVLIKNVNDEAVSISISVSGNLTKETKLNEESFVLEPNEEKKAYFTIKPKKPGTYETRILVKFSSLEEKEGIGGSGVGLSSVITLIVYGKGELPEEENGDVEGEEVGGEEENDEENPGLTGAAISNRKISFVPAVFLLITTLVLIFLLVMILKRIKKGKLENSKAKLEGSKVKLESSRKIESSKKLESPKAKLEKSKAKQNKKRSDGSS